MEWKQLFKRSSLLNHWPTRSQVGRGVLRVLPIEIGERSHGEESAQKDWVKVTSD